ncbi:MAG: efflux RND transporter permease subunit, partial [Phycisphaerales bacterium]|nr:efflux RND transporter permease subunit [Phycisphaerales bacterium]
MDIIRFSIQRPVSIAVGVIIVVMFGLISFGAIPIQLTPTVDNPIITVTTNWPGRAPEEIVDEIVKEQEERLKNVTDLRSMRSNSSQGSGVITLEFNVGADIDRGRQEVSDSLREVPEYPDDVDEPFITVAEGAAENAIAWIIVDLDPDHQADHPDYDITTLYHPLDKLVKPMLERIPGVAQVNIYGGRERELRVYVRPRELAARRLTHVDVIRALRSENRNVSAGTIAEGKRDIRVRLVGQFDTIDEVLDTVVDYRDGKPVFVRDVADVALEHQKQRGFVRSFGSPSLAINVIRQSDAN